MSATPTQRGNVSVDNDEESTVVNLSDGSPALSAAMQRCIAKPREQENWDALERAAETREQTTHVANVYRTTLQRDLPAALLVELGQRAVRFHDEWALDHEELVALLVRVLTIDPTVKWAFDRVSLELTMRDRREELLSLYDRVLAAVGEDDQRARRTALLEEAADVARQCGGQTDRAIGYLEQLFAADPRRATIAASLERLLSQQKRHEDLLTLWAKRMEVEAPAEVAKLRCRAASFCLETMDDPAASLTAIAPLEREPEVEPEAVCAILEKIVEASRATAETRSEALERLRARYDAAARPSELVRPLRVALRFAQGESVQAIHGEIARRLVEAERDDEACEHLAALIALDHDDALLDRILSNARAVELFGCRPRIDREGRRELVRRAAVASTSEPAIRLYERLLRDVPSDEQVIAGLAELYRAGERHESLVALRKHELALATDVARRQALRLELARLYLALADESSATDALRENLAEQPVDEGAIAAVTSTLEASGSFATLCEMLEAHGAEVAETHAEIATRLWSQVAEIAEHRLSDPRRAVKDHERVVAASRSAASLDALGRINTELGEHAAAARWLAELVAFDRAEKADDVHRLATARVAIDQRVEALACIEAFLADHPRELRLRMMQIDLLRESGDLERLVAALVDAAPHAEPPAASKLLREAASVLGHTLDAPSRAAELLERVVSLPGAETAARIDLADALHRSGRLVESQQMAQSVLAELGRRHPPERAGVHLLLARIAHEQGNGEATLQELEAAISIDVGNPRAQLMLGRVSRELGHLDRAERAFNALLLLQRRGGADDERPPMTETLVELHRLAALRGQSEQAAENLATAFDLAQRSEREAHGLEHALRDAQMPTHLVRAIEAHLARLPEPATRARLFGELSEVLETLGRSADAAAAALEGLAIAPHDARLHETARAACAKSEQSARYVASLDGAIAAALDRGDGALGCGLLLRLGEVHEEAGRLDEARDAYARAEDTSENLVDVWRHTSRLAARRGDRDARLAALRKLVDAAAELEGAERTETLYALAELELDQPETIEEGLVTLSRAMDCDARPTRAVAALREALRAAADPEPVARAYESIARAHGDEPMLLDALVVVCTLPGATQGALREAVELAERRDADERASQLLERAVTLSREGVEPEDGLWAMRKLAIACERKGDVRGAASWSRQAAEIAAPTEAAELRMKAASLATSAGDVDAAIDCYEKLLGTDPSDGQAWTAMLALLREHGDAERLDDALAKAAEQGADSRERNTLRMERARRLLDRAAKRAEAMSALHAVLDEQPDHTEAAGLLVDLLDPAHDRDDLVALLERRLEVAQERGDAEAGAPIALRLAELHDRAEALDIVRSALAWATASAPLLRRRVELLDPEEDAAERADAIEALLEHEGEGARRTLTIDLLRARVALGEVIAVERALAIVSPSDASHAAVVAALRWLADAKVAEAEENPSDAVRLLGAAAQIQSRLGDAEQAVYTLERARELAADDLELLGHHARALLELGRGGEAVTIVTSAIQRATEVSARAERLALRARLATALGDHRAAITDLQEATSTDGDRWLPELLAALENARAEFTASDSALALRQSDVLERMGRRDDARALLSSMEGEQPAVIRRLLDLDFADERWDDAIHDCQRLLAIARPSDLARVALRLADAAKQAGRPEDARDALERALDQEPTNTLVLDRLQEVYLLTGAFRELANRLFADAQRTDDAKLRFERLLEVGRVRLEHLGESAAAVGPLSDALALQPGHAKATLLLADALSGAGWTEDAEALLQAAIAQHGGRRSRALSDLQHRMARVVTKRDQSEALRWLISAFESNPKNVEIADELAKRAFALAHFDLALRALRTLTSKDFAPEVRARAYLGQASIALHQTNSARALMFAKKAHAEAPLAEVEHLLRRLDPRA